MSSSTSPSGAGQVCDRCRLKKVKCDGAVPACKNCTAAAVPCVISARLRRKTKIRGYQTPNSLQAENDELRRALATEKTTTDALRARLREVAAQTSSLHAAGIYGSRTMTANTLPPRRTSHSIGQSHLASSSATIVKHMGRMVPDGSGGERFSGSTSGVHFTLSVQHVLQARYIRAQPFPESCFCLHLLEPHSHRPGLSPSQEATADSPLLTKLLQHFNQPISFYMRQIDLFIEQWGAFCPIVASTDLSHALSLLLLQALETAPMPADVFQRHTMALFQMCVILLLNAMDSDSSDISKEQLDVYTRFVYTTVPQLTTRSDLPSLHGLVLFSFYLQVTNQPLLMVQMNGVLVRLAQSFGMHRHSRRFKLGVGQIEMRKRLWWWIYVFDKIVSIVHGLPKLIHDDDIDVDYPLDCDLDQVHSSSLSFPLPGETTRVSSFIAYVQLGRILSETLSELYTTTRRRRGPDKIANLHGKLQAWRQRWGLQRREQPSTTEPSHSDDDTASQASPAWDMCDGAAKMRLWLAFMASVTTMLIHRPALTFDANTPQFAENLPICKEACADILSILSSTDGRASILGIAPAVPSLILQCGLMEVFHVCHSTDFSRLYPGRGSHGDEPVLAMVDQAHKLLVHYDFPTVLRLSRSSAHSGPLDVALSEAGDLLRALGTDLKRFIAASMSKTSTTTTAAPLHWLQSPTDLSGLSPLDATSDGGTLPVQQAPSLSYTSHTTTPPAPAPFPMLGELGALDYLNQPAGLSWIFEDGSLIGPGPVSE